jgi:PAS domain S-box-containing protein
MNTAAAVETLFFCALEKGSAAERAAYLDSACGGDAELRRQVEKMLKVHPKVGDFLNKPICELLAAERKPPDATDEFNVSTDRTEPTLEQTEGEGSGNEGESDDLPFLLPSTRPDSLGRIGHYEVIQVLGKGGFGIVLRAFDEVLQREVALKVLAPALAGASSARKRFLREARSSAQVRHENVVQIHAVQEQPLPYLVMEFIPGETLQQRLDRVGPLEVQEIVRIGREIAEGLAAAHATGLIHRDIKPGNILLEAGSQVRVKITDFGLARAADDASLTQRGALAGTPMYMAPEQAEGETLDHRADLFSLGSVLYVMATGRPPFRAATTVGVLKRVVSDEPRPIRDVIPEIPQWLCEIIARLHSKKPQDRFATAREVADLLGSCLAEMQRPENVSFLIGFGEAMRAARRGAEASQKDILEKNAFLEREVQSWRRSDKRFAHFMQHLPSLAWIKDLQGRYVYANDAAAKAFGTSRDRLYGKTDNEVFPPKTAAQFEENDRRALASDTGVQIIETLEHDDGIVHHSIVSKFLILGADNKPALIGGLAIDVTDQLHGMAAGRPPLQVSTAAGVLKQVVEKGPQSIQDGVSEIPQWLGEIIARLHSKEPEDRFATDREVAELLRCCLAEIQGLGKGLIFQDITLAEPEKIPLSSREILEAVPTKLRKRFRTRHWVVVAAALSMLLGGLGFTEATGLTDFHGAVIRLFSPEGTLVIEVDDPGVSVKIDGSDIVITGAGAKEIRLKPGRYTVEGIKDGKIVSKELVTVTNNGKQVVRISQEAKVAKAATDAAAWERVVAGLSPAEQVKAVGARLKELNPDFDCKVESAIENGAVVGLRFTTDHVKDISPIHALTRLQKLDMRGSAWFKGSLADLTPLKGMQLWDLNLTDNGAVIDLSALKAMPLKNLNIMQTGVTDLTPLKGMSLQWLMAWGFLGTDLTPLEGMPLKWLNCGGRGQKLDLTPLARLPLEFLCINLTQVSDLTPLKDVPLTTLQCSNTPVSDLTPLRGKRLKHLHCFNTKVADLSPLKGMPLEILECQSSGVTDLSLLKDLPLTYINCDFRPERDAKILRAIPTLKTINGKPAAEFWRSIEKK